MKKTVENQCKAIRDKTKNCFALVLLGWTNLACLRIAERVEKRRLTRPAMLDRWTAASIFSDETAEVGRREYHNPSNRFSCHQG